MSAMYQWGNYTHFQKTEQDNNKDRHATCSHKWYYLQNPESQILLTIKLNTTIQNSQKIKLELLIRHSICPQRPANSFLLCTPPNNQCNNHPNSNMLSLNISNDVLFWSFFAIIFITYFCYFVWQSPSSCRPVGHVCTFGQLQSQRCCVAVLSNYCAGLKLEIIACLIWIFRMFLVLWNCW